MCIRDSGNSFDTLFQQAANHRIIIATFASNVHRVQQIMDAAQKYGKKVAVSGRSMVNVVTKAIELGYLTVPKGLLVEIENTVSYTHLAPPARRTARFADARRGP